MTKTHKPAPILPRQNLAGSALTAVTLVMSFLACLALGASLLADKAAENWLIRATSAMSVQIVETHRQTPTDQLPAVLRELEATPGLAAYRVLQKDELTALLEPWLGTGNIGEDLPIPLLIELRPDAPDSLATQPLAARLQAVAPGARLDTHGNWRQTLAHAATSLRLFAGLVMVMVMLATITVILFATRAGLLANAETLYVLHQIGAQDGFISRHFEAHFTRAVSWAALGGMVAALLFFYLLGGLFADARNPELALFLLPVPITTILLSWLVTRQYVRHRLRLEI
ncbi:MAG: cell division protein FtsX [Parvibaculales bacterium]